MTDKSALRTEVRRRLDLLSAVERAERSRRICERLRALPVWQRSRRAAIYSALPDEPDLSTLMGESGPRLCFPKITGDALVFLDVRGAHDLEPSRWNLREPVYRPEAVVRLAEIDLLLVPGVAFTRDGHRMGRGRGYYDRLLASEGFCAETVGVCFREQLVEALPLESHDLPVNGVIAE